jgi:hypothetical protein
VSIARRCSVSGPAAAEGLQRRLRLPALEDVDTAGVDQVRADREVEAANSSASLFDNARTVREVGLALQRLNGDVSCNDDHGCAPALLPPVQPAGLFRGDRPLGQEKLIVRQPKSAGEHRRIAHSGPSLIS